MSYSSKATPRTKARGSGPLSRRREGSPTNPDAYAEERTENVRARPRHAVAVDRYRLAGFSTSHESKVVTTSTGGRGRPTDWHLLLSHIDFFQSSPRLECGGSPPHRPLRKQSAGTHGRCVRRGSGERGRRHGLGLDDDGPPERFVAGYVPCLLGRTELANFRCGPRSVPPVPPWLCLIGFKAGPKHPRTRTGGLIDAIWPSWSICKLFQDTE